MANITSTKPAFSLAPQNLAEAMQFAEVICKSSIIPKDYQNNSGNILIAMQWGAEIGLQPLQAMQNIAVINGRPAIWGDSALALVKGSGLLEYIKEDPTDTGCTCTIKRKGEPEATRTFTIEDAKRANLLGKQGPWTQYPKRMMQMRARSFALRDVFPDVLRGVGIAEEVRDIPQPSEKNMGNAEVVQPVASSKTEALKKRIAAQASQAASELEGIKLEEVLKAIADAKSTEELSNAAELAAQLQDPADKEKARAAYREKKKELCAPHADADTGEVKITFAIVADQMKLATNKEALDMAADNIAMLPADQQEELKSMYKSLAKKFE